MDFSFKKLMEANEEEMDNFEGGFEDDSLGAEEEPEEEKDLFDRMADFITNLERDELPEEIQTEYDSIVGELAAEDEENGEEDAVNGDEEGSDEMDVDVDVDAGEFEDEEERDEFEDDEDI